MKPYRMSKKFIEWWETLPVYDNKGSSIWSYRVWNRLGLNKDTSFPVKDIVAFTKQYFDERKDNKFLYSPGKILELGYSKDFAHESEEEKFRRMYTRGVK